MHTSWTNGSYLATIQNALSCVLGTDRQIRNFLAMVWFLDSNRQRNSSLCLKKLQEDIGLMARNALQFAPTIMGNTIFENTNYSQASPYSSYSLLLAAALQLCTDLSPMQRPRPATLRSNNCLSSSYSAHREKRIAGSCFCCLELRFKPVADCRHRIGIYFAALIDNHRQLYFIKLTSFNVARRVENFHTSSLRLSTAPSLLWMLGSVCAVDVFIA